MADARAAQKMDKGLNPIQKSELTGSRAFYRTILPGGVAIPVSYSAVLNKSVGESGTFVL